MTMYLYKLETPGSSWYILSDMSVHEAEAQGIEYVISNRHLGDRIHITSVVTVPI